MALLKFTVRGPFEIPVVQKKKGRMISENCPKFWRSRSKLKKKQGCYIFGIRAGKGYRPIYIGKATKSFEKECFTLHKIGHYNPALLDIEKGTPIMFFVVAPLKQGQVNHSKIESLEKFLIETGYMKNPDLSNIQNKPNYKWGITGVVRGGKGHPGKAVLEFKKLLGLNKKV